MYLNQEKPSETLVYPPLPDLGDHPLIVANELGLTNPRGVSSDNRPQVWQVYRTSKPSS